MNRFEISCAYQQFYVADIEFEPQAPEVWTDAHVTQRHNTLQYITALSPEGSVTARIVSCGPEDQYPEMPDPMDFEVCTAIDVPSGKIGVFEWPWEICDDYVVEPGVYRIYFRGYAVSKVASQQDYYGVEIRKMG